MRERVCERERRREGESESERKTCILIDREADRLKID